jgi:quinol monooxygenase YgiN
MIILRFKIRSKPDKSDELMAALAEIITPARATEGVINSTSPASCSTLMRFIATAVYEDGAALERQESLPEVDRVWRCCRNLWWRRPSERSLTRRSARRSSKFDGGYQRRDPAWTRPTNSPLSWSAEVSGLCRSVLPGQADGR